MGARGRAAAMCRAAYIFGRAAPRGDPIGGGGWRWPGGTGGPPLWAPHVLLARSLHSSVPARDDGKEGGGGPQPPPWSPAQGFVDRGLSGGRLQGWGPKPEGGGAAVTPLGALHQLWSARRMSTRTSPPPPWKPRRHAHREEEAAADPARKQEEALGLAAVESPDPGFIPGRTDLDVPLEQEPEPKAEGGSGAAGGAGCRPAAGSGGGGLCRPFISHLPGDDRALRAVHVALFANTAIMGSKAVAYGVTGSSSMMAEAIHSMADVANQLLLWYGIRSTHKNPDHTHNYGYMRERFVWSLISAVGILCMGSGVTFIHGVHMMMDPHPIEQVEVGLAVLAGSLALEGWSLSVAVRSLQESARENEMSFWRYVQKGQDPTSVAVMMEDLAAVSGLVVAGACLAASVHTGNPIFDGAGSVMVAGLLGTIATFLIQKNRAFLIGRSMDHADTGRILAHIQADSVVKAIHDVKTEEVGPGVYRFKAEIEFNGEELVERHLARTGRAGLFRMFRSASGENASDEAIEAVVKQYGEAVVEALGDEVDRLEQEIVQLVPGIRHVDIEAY